jgi:hypothetical protein
VRQEFADQKCISKFLKEQEQENLTSLSRNRNFPGQKYKNRKSLGTGSFRPKNVLKISQGTGTLKLGTVTQFLSEHKLSGRENVHVIPLGTGTSSY